MVSAAAPPAPPPPGLSPRRTTLMLKPVGASCNLRCAYCYYLPVADGYDAPAQRMPLDTLGDVLAGYLPDAPDQVTLSWQGGEPTLVGVRWFERMVELVEKHRRPTQQVTHCLQTNGTLIDDRWGAFFHRHRFLVGLSLDGLMADHDHYRIDQHPQPRGTYRRVLDGLAVLRQHNVEHNVLVVLNDRNVEKPAAVWKQLMALRLDWLQFIPAVEWVPPAGNGFGGPDAEDRWRLADFTPSGEAYGRFLCDVFDRWFDGPRTRVSVRVFDAELAALVTGRASECTYAESCAGQLTLEHDGAVYACDHFVQPEWKLGHVRPPTVPLTIGGSETDQSSSLRSRGGIPQAPPPDWMQRLDVDRFHRFGDRKQQLDATCRRCEYRPLCHGGCPKHRPARGDLPGPSVLCPGYRAFFAHALPRLRWLADHLRRGTTPPSTAPGHLTPRRPVATRNASRCPTRAGAAARRPKRRKKHR